MRDAISLFPHAVNCSGIPAGLAAASALAGVAIPSVHAAERQHDPGGPGRLRRPRHRRARRTPCRPRAARSSWSPWPTCSRTSSTAATTSSSKEHFGDKVDVPDDRKFIGFDGYKKAMDCLKPGDVVDPRHAAGLPLGAVRLRDREGPERLHGEAGHRRRPDHAQDAGAGRRSRARRT